MDTRHRVFGIGILLLLLSGVCVGYAITDQWEYPRAEDIDETPEAYDGDAVLLFGEVTSIDTSAGELVLEVDSDVVIEMTVQDVPAGLLDTIGVDGSAIQVYGTLREESSVLVADEIVIDFRDTNDRIYTYGVSILGGILAAGYFLRYWRIDFRRLRFESRGDG